jgi:hypothetical protein
METTSIYIAASSIIAALLSAVVMLRGQKLGWNTESKAHKNEEVRVIFEGYGHIVDELRIEVERLTGTIVSLKEEQQACDERNKELSIEVEQLKSRISQLETNNG